MNAKASSQSADESGTLLVESLHNGWNELALGEGAARGNEDGGATLPCRLDAMRITGREPGEGLHEGGGVPVLNDGDKGASAPESCVDDLRRTTPIVTGGVAGRRFWPPRGLLFDIN